MGEILSPLSDPPEWLQAGGYEIASSVLRQVAPAIYGVCVNVLDRAARGKLAPGDYDARLSFPGALVITREALASPSTA